MSEASDSMGILHQNLIDAGWGKLHKEDAPKSYFYI